MSEAQAASAQGVGKVVEIERSFAAPRELVWAAITEPAQLAQWWGPGGWDNPVCEVDLRPGGRLFIEMRGPEPWGSHPMGGTVHEVDPPQRFVFSSRAFGNDQDGWQLEARNTITLVEQAGGTLLKLHAEVTRATDAVAGALSGMEMGWSQSFDKLATLLGEESEPCGDLKICLPDDTSIRIQRTFAAPPELLWAATTEREHLMRWWGGCDQVKLVECGVDLRVGGSYRHVLRDPAGNEFGFGGRYLELDPGKRVVQTFVFDPYPEAEAVETAEYEAVPGGARLTVTIRHKTKEARDGHYYSGMENGMKASYCALDSLLEQLQGGQA